MMKSLVFLMMAILPNLAVATSSRVDSTINADISNKIVGEKNQGDGINLQKNTPIATSINVDQYVKIVNELVWSAGMKKNTAMSVKLQVLLDWNHVSVGVIDGGFGANSVQALKNFQQMHALPVTGKMDEATWAALNTNINPNADVLVTYTITKEDVNTDFVAIPKNTKERAKLKSLGYQNIEEMLAERFHMDIRYLKKLNPTSTFVAGERIIVVNTASGLDMPITRLQASIADNTLYAYYGDALIAAYPATIGNKSVAAPMGNFKITSRIKMPWYKATAQEDDKQTKTYMLPAGANSPVGMVWLALSKPTCAIHGLEAPQMVGRKLAVGCIGLTNWDALEVFDNIAVGVLVEIK